MILKNNTCTNSAATSYINTIVTQNQLQKLFPIFAAMSGVSANNKMLEQQKADKSIAEKQVANNEAINAVI